MTESGRGGAATTTMIPQGSAVAIAPDRVVTCAHVVDDIPLSAYPALSRDADGKDTTLVAVTRVLLLPGSDLAFLEAPGLAAKPSTTRVADIEPGDEVFWIGHPFGLSPSVRAGVVAAIERTPVGREIRVDGTVNAGDSGGGLFARSDGRLIGILQSRQGGLSNELLATAASSTEGGLVLRRALRELEGQLQVGIGYAIHAENVDALLRKEALGPETKQRK